MNNYLSISKICLIGIIIYFAWMYGALGPHDIVLYGLFIVATTCIGIDILNVSKVNKNVLSSVIPLLAVFALVSAITGIFIALDITLFLKSIQNFIVYIIICFEINYVSWKQKNVDWILHTFVVSGFLIIITNIFFGLATDYVVTVNINKMSDFSNPNSEGFILVFGTFAILALNKCKINIFNLLYICLAVYTIFIGASRKSLIAESVLLLYTIICFFSINSNKRDFKKQIEKSAIFILMILAALKSVDLFVNSPIYQRFQLLDSGINNRYQLIKDAIKLFWENPIFGVGFRQYEVYFKIYTHNTYFEILSCTGLVGACIWLYYFAKLFFNNYMINKKYFDSNISYGFYILFIIVLLFLGSGSILFYDLTSLIMLNYVFFYPRLLRINALNKKI